MAILKSLLQIIICNIYPVVVLPIIDFMTLGKLGNSILLNISTVIGLISITSFLLILHLGYHHYRLKHHKSSSLNASNSESYIIHHILKALNNDGFELFFQPIYRLKDKKIISLEALIRFSDKNCKINIESMICVAEKYQLIQRLDYWVFDQVAKHISSEFSNNHTIHFHVNISTHTINMGFVTFLSQLKNKYGVGEDCIILEILEHSIVQNINQMNHSIREIKKLGFRIALDDFGTKGASIKCLDLLEVDIVKVDRYFINMLHHKGKLLILKDIVELIQHFDKEIIVEGIETEDMLNALLKMGIKNGQGYYLKKPKPLDEIIDILFLAE